MYDDINDGYYIYSRQWKRYWQVIPSFDLIGGRDHEPSIGAWERFQIENCGGNCWAFKSTNFNRYVISIGDSTHTLKASATALGPSEQFSFHTC